MIQWILTIVAVFGASISIGTFIWTQSKFQKGQTDKDTALEIKVDNLTETVKEIKQAIGNGAYRGLRQDIQDIKVNCAGHISDMISMQREIDEIKVR
jgi:hypothetical protein